MNKDIATARDILIENNYTCVLYSNGTQYNSKSRGVKPLIEFLETGNDFKNFCAADKTVGAGAAHLYVLLGIKLLWANIISEDAIKILQQNNISFFYEKSVPFIINRSKDGPCPIETAVKGITCSKQALEAIKKALQILINKS